MATSEVKAHTKVRGEKCSLEWTIESFSQLGGNILKSPPFSAVDGTVSWTMRLFDRTVENKSIIRVDLIPMRGDSSIPLQCSYTYRLSNSEGFLITSRSGNDQNKYHYGELDLIQKEVLLSKLDDDIVKIQADVVANICITTIPFLENLSQKVLGTATALFETRKFTDLVIRVQETDVPVHKSVLSLKSSVFEAMLLHDTSEVQLDVVELKDIELTTVKAMIEFFYMNVVSKLDVTLALDLLRAADEYNVVDLTKYCSSYLQGNICPSNVIDILMVASTLSVPELKEECLKYISKNKPLKLDDKHKEKMELIKDMLLEYFCEV